MEHILATESINTAKERLAFEITQLVHGKEAAQEALPMPNKIIVDEDILDEDIEE